MAETTAPAAPGKDDIDPELVKLRRKSQGAGPLLALSVIVISGYLMITLRSDFRYALSDKAPRELPAPTAASLNRHVTLRATLDATWTVRVRGRQDTGHRLVAAQGTGGLLWLQVEGEPMNLAADYDESYTGRLLRLDDLEYGSSARSRLRIPLTSRIVFLDGIQGDKVVDATGLALAPAPGTPTYLDERVHGVALVTLVASDDWKDEATAGAALVTAGLTSIASFAVDKSSDGWTFEIPAPDGLDALRARLRELKLHHKISVAPKTHRHAGDWKDLTVASTGVTFAGTSLPRDSVERVLVHVAPEIPAGALVLVEGDSPGAHWWLMPLYGVLTLVSLLMLWSLARGVRAALRREAQPQ